MDSETLLTLLLGGGLAGTIGAFAQGVKSLQTGARAREKDTVNSLVTQRNEAWEDRDKAIDQRDYWRNWAATVEYEARSQGIELPNRPAMKIGLEDD